MGSEWRQSTWGDEISLEYGKAKRDYKDGRGNVRVFGSNGPVGWTDEALCDGPGVILGRKGAYRGVEYSVEPFFVIDTAYYVVPKTELDMRWLYYAIKHHRLGEIDDGSPVPSTTRAAVYVRSVEIPPLPEQQAIAGVLGSLDDKIELNRRMNRTLESMARALFKSWFVDFDPVHANAAGKPTLLPDLAAHFPAAFESSPLGDIPEGWEVGRFDDLLVLQRGFDLPKKDRIDGAYPLMAASGPSGTHNEAKVEAPGVVTGRSGKLGEVSIVFDDFWPLNTTLWVKQFKRTSPIHAYFHLRTLDFEMFNAGSAVPTLNRNHVHSLPTLLPSREIVDAFSDLVMPLFQRIETNDAESRVLAALRDALLPKLLGGELSVANNDVEVA